MRVPCPSRGWGVVNYVASIKVVVIYEDCELDCRCSIRYVDC